MGAVVGLITLLLVMLTGLTAGLGARKAPPGCGGLRRPDLRVQEPPGSAGGSQKSCGLLNLGTAEISKPGGDATRWRERAASAGGHDLPNVY